MRFYRITFFGGLAIGYVLGAQAGRERYEQLKRLARKAAESPAMQQTAGALQAQATATARSAKDKATSGVRKSASKVARRVPASRSGRAGSDQAAASKTGTSMSGNGATPRAPEGDGDRPFVPANGSLRQHDLL
jgi:hypothetical protein